jgi:hypothetical protein
MEDLTNAQRSEKLMEIANSDEIPTRKLTTARTDLSFIVDHINQIGGQAEEAKNLRLAADHAYLLVHTALTACKLLESQLRSASEQCQKGTWL